MNDIDTQRRYQARWPIVFVRAVAILLLAFGAIYLIWPEAMARASGTHLTTPAAIIEYRAYYGGLQLGLGVFVALISLHRSLLPMALQLLLCCFGLVLLTRVASLLIMIVSAGAAIDGFHITAIVLELLIVILSAVALHNTPALLNQDEVGH